MGGESITVNARIHIGSCQGEHNLWDRTPLGRKMRSSNPSSSIAINPSEFLSVLRPGIQGYAIRGEYFVFGQGREAKGRIHTHRLSSISQVK